MEFIQIVEARAADIEPLLAVDEEWQKATEGKRTVRRSIVTRDRNDPDCYRVIVFFDSYESAMKNSNLPETKQFAEKMAGAVKEPMTFLDLDVIVDHS